MTKDFIRYRYEIVKDYKNLSLKRNPLWSKS